MTMPWSQLNIIESPEVSPPAGPSDPNSRSEELLSNPVSHAEVLAQLEAWTNINFDTTNEPAPFDNSIFASNQFLATPGSQSASGFYQAPAPYSFVNGMETAQDRLGRVKGKSFEKGFSGSVTPLAIHDPSSSVQGQQKQTVLTQNLVSGFPVFSESDILAAPYLAGAEIAASLPFHSIENNTQYSVPPATAVASPLNSSCSNAPSPAVVLTESQRKAANKQINTSKAIAKAKLKALPADAPAEERELLENAIAIEEDKRRRNTAASARFRVKKKEREQAMQKTAQQLQDKVSELEKEVDTLRKENGWLRGLIIDREKGVPIETLTQALAKGSPPTQDSDSRPAKRSRKDVTA